MIDCTKGNRSHFFGKFLGICNPDSPLDLPNFDAELQLETNTDFGSTSVVSDLRTKVLKAADLSGAIKDQLLDILKPPEVTKPSPARN